MKEELTIQDYKEVVMNPGKRAYKDFTTIESITHQLRTAKKRKLALSTFDDKRYILDDGINTRAQGHYRKFKVDVNLD